MRNDINIKELEGKLRAELAEVEKELGTVGKKNPTMASDWEPIPESMDTQKSDPNEVADKFESLEENTLILKSLEIRFAEINRALERIKTNSYGMCNVCNKPIEKERLIANPAAETCKKDME